MTRTYRKYNYAYPADQQIEVYGYTPNNREVRVATINGRTYYWVQPRNDNYWICVASPTAARKAYARPELFD